MRSAPSRNVMNGDRDGSGAVAGAEPAWDRHGEAARRSSRHYHVHLAHRGKLGDELVERRRRALPEAEVRALAVVVVGQEGTIGDADRLIQMPGEIGAAPALVAESAGVLGPDHNH